MNLNLLAGRRVVRLFARLFVTVRKVAPAFGMVALVGCTSVTTRQSTSPTPSLYNDPFAYCAAVGTIDKPDERYTGTEIPEAIIQGMVEQGIVSADAPLEFQQNAVWRCMDSQVWVCHFGANLPCLEEADVSQVPTSAMEDFCKENPGADSIPAVVTGRSTVYEWGCKGEEPEVIRQLFKRDAQGYLADFWYALALK